jgi:hypothetical protein
MHIRYPQIAAIMLTISLAFALPTSIQATATPSSKETTMMHASGDFDVKMTPQPATPGFEATHIGRQTIDKRFHGDLDGTSQGEMLAMMTETQGSGAYVALEQVTGTLHGKHGSFTFVHSATMHRGVPDWSVQVAPDSGTGELVGLSGAMVIHIDDKGKHTYTFDYSVP